MTLKLYLDSGILIACYAKKDIDPLYKKDRHIEVIKILKATKESNQKIRLYISNWAILETIRVLVKVKNFDELKVNNWINGIISTQSLLKNELILLRFSKDYYIDNLFQDIKKALLTSKEKVHTGDIINVICMKKHKINKILTFNDKDYSGFSNIYPYNPFKTSIKKSN